jgi:hypothetical protein
MSNDRAIMSYELSNKATTLQCRKILQVRKVMTAFQLGISQENPRVFAALGKHFQKTTLPRSTRCYNGDSMCGLRSDGWYEPQLMTRAPNFKIFSFSLIDPHFYIYVESSLGT